MFEKTKKFYKDHELEVIAVGTLIAAVGTGVLIGTMMKPDQRPIQIKLNDALLYDNSKDRAILEGFGAVFKEGNSVPFATKEIATKFLEERGNTYQLDILDDVTSVIWISE